MKFILSAVLGVLLLISCKTREPEADLVIAHVNRIDLESGSVYPNQFIYITGDRITAVLDSAEAAQIDAKETLDATAKYLMTGLWDNHVHFRGGDSLITENKNLLNLYIANGITTVRDAGGDLTGSVQDWQNQIESGNLTGPDIYTSGPKIDGPGATWAGSLEVSGEAEIEAALDSLQQLNVDFVKIYDSTISAENYLDVIAKAEARGMITSGHMPYSVMVEEAVNSGIDAMEHLYYVLKGCSAEEKSITEAVKTGQAGFWSSLDRVMQSYSDTTAQKTFKMLRDQDVFVVPTLHIGHTLSYLDEENHTDDSYLKYMGPGIQKTYGGRINSAKNASPEFVVMRKNLDSAFVKLAGDLHRNGVKLLAGSDCGAFNSYVYPGESLHQELQALVDAGLTPLEALQTSALNGADFLKKDKPVIQTDAVADLVLLNANPLENIGNTQNVFAVIKRGNLYSKQDLENLLKKVTNQ
ncbi:MAG: amidohydrolase [Leeuwenhoekiella sp.]|nr:MAG: amidohydrolase [Leeuwenhoekiella sp.]